jgi:hypothetical protein
MRTLLEQIMGASIFISSAILDNAMKGTISVKVDDYPSSGMPARELKVFINVPEFKRMEIYNGEVRFHYEV